MFSVALALECEDEILWTIRRLDQVRFHEILVADD